MHKLNFETSQRTVTAAGTPERLFEGKELRIVYIGIRALLTNAGNIYIGKSPTTAVSTATPFILSAGETIDLDINSFTDCYLDLSDIWIDSDNNGEGVAIIYLELPK